MNRKGFTLTELLVVVVILGIIAGLSIPLIRNLSTSFEKKKYENYADSVLSSAKLYNDSYSEDLFGHNEYGCAYITYDKLMEKKLIKDIEIEDTTCNSNKTYIRVIKQKDKYGYKTFLTCGKEKEGKLDEVTTTIPDVVPEMDTNACTGVKYGNLSITADLSEANGKADKEKKKTKIKISSGTGIDNKIIIYAKWSQNENDQSDGGFTRVEFKVKEDQEETLLGGNLITTQSKELLTPSGNGDYYLIVRVDHLQDLHGNVWKNPNNTNSKYVSFGPFTIDNTPPTINTVIYNCDSTGYKTGSAITSKQVTNGTNTVWDLSDITGNKLGWLTSSKYGQGVCYGFEIADNQAIKSYQWEWNTTGLKENAANVKSLVESTKEEYDHGITSTEINKSTRANGHRYTKFTVTDYAGHKTAIYINLKLDTTGPSTPTISNSSGGNWTNKNVTLTLGSTDALVDMGEYYYSYNANASEIGSNSTTQWVQLNGGKGKTSFTTEPWTAETNKTVYVAACDILGNCSGKNSTPIKIDKTKPSKPTITNSSGGNWTKSNVTLTLGATDNLSGIGEYYYSYNSGANTIGNNSTTQWVQLNGGKGKSSFTTEAWTAETNKTVYVVVCDIAGNCSDSNNTPIKIDKTAPSKPTITNSSGGNWTNKDITLTLGSTDAASGIGEYYYSYNSGANTIGNNSGTQWVLLNGGKGKTSFTTEAWTAETNKTVYVTACDVAGNCASSNNTPLKIDKTGPVCGDTTKTRQYSRDGVNGSKTCSDAASGCTQSSYSFTNQFPGATLDMKDNAGNTTTCQLYIYTDPRTESYTSTCYDTYEYVCGYWINEGTCSSCDKKTCPASNCTSGIHKWLPYRKNTEVPYKQGYTNWIKLNGSTSMGTCWYDCTTPCLALASNITCEDEYSYSCTKYRTYYVYY